MKIKNLISLLLTVCMLLSVLVSFASINVFAADGEETEDDKVQTTEDIVNEYLTKEFNTPEEKLATMTKKLTKDGFELYADPNTGEVATKNLVTGEILFTNPYDVATEGAVSSAKDTIPDLLSQIVVEFTDTEDKKQVFNSFNQAAKSGQIKVKNIKNGVRVEYVIGRMESKYLVPRMMTKERFYDYIYYPLQEAVEEGLITQWELNKIYKEEINGGEYVMKYWDDINDTAEFPVLKELQKDVFVYQMTTQKELTQTEVYIKQFCPAYSYEEMEKDHAMCKYESEDKNPPNFKMALEYIIDKEGLSVTLPASGIRFNQELYTLESITVLPYMGSGSYREIVSDGADTGYRSEDDDGYIFFPDGSGTIFEFAELSKSGSTLSVTGNVYGFDYAYQTLEGGSHQEAIRYPVYGIVDNVNSENPTGFLAIIEEGDSLASLTASSGGATHKYFNVQMEFFPRPKDTYIVSDSVSIGSSNEWTVISSRKYTGNYKIKYIMLSEKDGGYDPTWLGMAEAYRDYLINKEVLSPIEEKDVDSDIPLYIESFGSMKTTEKILSVPVQVMTPMTTFEDVQSMYNTLKEHGIDNVNFRLTGFANGGMYSRVPYKLKWESKVGGKKGFEELLGFAKSVNDGEEGHLGIYPDFDFAYIRNTGLFDGLSNKKHAVKTIDNRYSSKRYYSATKQTYISYFELAISPAYFDHFYTELTERYIEYSLTGDGKDLGISIASLGTSLNSDFDEDEPYNREDSKELSILAFRYFDEKYGSVMTDGANAYAWKYIDYILNAPLTSSRYLQSSAAVPFMGTVLHGFIQYAGSPINMEGNTQYALLKAIENGASIYFTLSYKNTEILKEDDYYNKYYSIMYNIWVGEVNEDGVFEEGQLMGLYEQLNSALSELQTSNIIGHKFIRGTRLLNEKEVADDLFDIEKYVEEKLLEDEEKYAKSINDKIQAGFVLTLSEVNEAAELLSASANPEMITLLDDVANKLAAYNDAAEENKAEAFEALEAAYNAYASASAEFAAALEVMENVYCAYKEMTENQSVYSDSFVSAMNAKADVVNSYFDAIETVIDARYTVEKENNRQKYAEDKKADIEEEYVISDKTIVQVTYGKGDTAEKVFFLNYNYFDVEIEYNGEKITIEAYGFKSR